MGFLGKIGNWLWNGSKSFASTFGFDTSSFENDEGQNFQAQQAQLNRDFQKEMFQKQLDYNTEMWNKTNKYNSASEQMKRYRDAGLNPYLMMTGGASAGVASSQSAGSSPQGSSPSGGFANTHPGSGVGFMQYLQDKKLKETQRNSIDLDNSKKQIELLTLQDRLMEQLIGSREDNRSKQIENAWKSDLMNQTFKNMQAQERQINSVVELNMVEKAYKSAELQYIPQKLRAEISAIIANLALTKGMTNTERWKAFEAQTRGLNGYHQYKLNNRTFENQVNRIINESRSANIYDIPKVASVISNAMPWH